EATPVAAADTWHTDVDLVRCQPGKTLHHCPRLLRRLRGYVERGAGFVQAHQAIHRFAGGMRQPRLVIDGFDAAGGFALGLVDIAVVADARGWCGIAVDERGGLLFER